MTSILVILLLVILIAAFGFLLLRSQRESRGLSVENARLVAEVENLKSSTRLERVGILFCLSL